MPDRLARGLAGHDEAVAFTRSETLASHLRAVVGRLAVRDPQPPKGVPAGRWFADAVEAFGLDPSPAPPPCVASSEEDRGATEWRERLPAGFLAVHPGSGSPRKNWPEERFEQLVDRLRPPEPWLVVCGPADVAPVEPFRGRTDCVIAEGLPIRVLGAVLARAGVFVGNDSGVTHLAAAWGAPTVALFGPTDAKMWSPDGEHVRTVQSPTDDMVAIPLAEVLAAVRAT